MRFELIDEIDHEYQRQIRRLLSHDDLTGLLSSRSFFSELRREAARAAHQTPFCVLMMDVDYFKTVNDTYGHLTGSKTLEEIGVASRKICVAAMSQHVSAAKNLPHFCSMPNPHRGLSRRKESVRKLNNVTLPSSDRAISRKASRYDQHRDFVFRTIRSDPIELIEMADSALYRAKREGRNRVCAYRDLPPEETGTPLPKRQD